MDGFTERELQYLRSEGEKRRGRLIVGREGEVYRLLPVRISYNDSEAAIEIAPPEALHVGVSLPFDGAAQVELVVEDLASIEPWAPRGVEIVGTAMALKDPPLIRIRPETIRSWGL